MSIERTTKRNSHIWNDQITVRRARESEPAVTYIVVWKLHNPTKWHWNNFKVHESKPTNRITEAVKRYERRTEHAVFVELIKYHDDGMSTVRRFCNLGRYRQIADDADWVLNVTNPPYEFEDAPCG